MSISRTFMRLSVALTLLFSLIVAGANVAFAEDRDYGAEVTGVHVSCGGPFQVKVHVYDPYGSPITLHYRGDTAHFSNDHAGDYTLTSGALGLPKVITGGGSLVVSWGPSDQHVIYNAVLALPANCGGYPSPSKSTEASSSPSASRSASPSASTGTSASPSSSTSTSQPPITGPSTSPPTTVTHTRPPTHPTNPNKGGGVELGTGLDDVSNDIDSGWGVLMFVVIAFAVPGGFFFWFRQRNRRLTATD